MSAYLVCLTGLHCLVPWLTRTDANIIVVRMHWIRGTNLAPTRYRLLAACPTCPATSPSDRYCARQGVPALRGTLLSVRAPSIT